MVVWPESAIPFPMRAESLPSVLSRSVFRDPVRAGEPPIDVPILLGAVVDQRAEATSAQAAFVRERSRLWISSKPLRKNAAILAMPDGTIAGEYDKQTLVPFGEYVPFETRWPWLRRLTPRAGDFDRGLASSSIVLNGKGVLVLICYEDILAERVRAAVAASEPDLLVDISSDAWFTGSGVPALHAALAQLRAIEHRRYLVHATNTGLTVVVDPVGREVLRLPSERSAAATADIRWLHETTVYESLGSLPSIGLAIAAGLLLLRLRPRERMENGPS
jgi:apolipoprotein N-acyltransferase